VSDPFYAEGDFLDVSSRRLAEKKPPYSEAGVHADAF
jgi:hypothetical protein